MQVAGFLMLVAGAVITLAAIALLPAVPARTAFVLAAVCVEFIGLVLVFRAHIPPDVAKKDRG